MKHLNLIATMALGYLPHILVIAALVTIFTIKLHQQPSVILSTSLFS